MKTDLITAIGIAIVGVFVSYLCCSLFFGSDDSFKYSFNTVDKSSASTQLADPNVNVFNYKALNPTVEVYVGNCERHNDEGECIDEEAAEEIINIEEE